MINNREEYRRMYEVERKLWWYKTLHQRTVRTIRQYFESRTPIPKILDAACGTGGFIEFLGDNGLTDACGFDYSEFAVEFSQKRGLDVGFGDLKHIELFRPEEKYDVICCHDALYFLSDEEITSALVQFRSRLKTGGILIINIHAFQVFSGTHDVAVGSTRRFTLRDFRRYALNSGFQIQHHTYWPFILSLPILLVRQWQQWRLRNQRIDPGQIDSDVSYPGDFVNTLLIKLMKIEERILPGRPFGSSLFLVLK